MKRHEINRTKYLETFELLSLKRILTLDCRNDVLITLAIECGARASELLNITQANLFDANQSVLIRALKDGRDREVPLRPELYKAVKQFTPFGISYQRLDQIWRHYRPVEKKFHSLRHTFALELYRRTRDIKLVQTALGHRDIKTTMVYVDYVYSVEEMRRLLLPTLDPIVTDI